MGDHLMLIQAFVSLASSVAGIGFSLPHKFMDTGASKDTAQ